MEDGYGRSDGGRGRALLARDGAGRGLPTCGEAVRSLYGRGHRQSRITSSAVRRCVSIPGRDDQLMRVKQTYPAVRKCPAPHACDGAVQHLPGCGHQETHLWSAQVSARQSEELTRL